MSDIFKLKVCIGNANIELEGEGNLVHTIFSELREDDLGKLSKFSSCEIKTGVLRPFTFISKYEHLLFILFFYAKYRNSI